MPIFSEDGDVFDTAGMYHLNEPSQNLNSSPDLSSQPDTPNLEGSGPLRLTVHPQPQLEADGSTASTMPLGSPTEAPDALNEVSRTYPTLASHIDNSVLQYGTPTGPDDDRQLEFYHPDDTSNPNPGKNTLEIFNKDLKGPDLTDTIAGDLLHRVGALDDKTGQPVDPKFYALKQELSNAREDFHKKADADAYERDKKSPYGAPATQEEFDKQSRLDAYVRAVAFPKQNPEWNNKEDSFVTPKMKDIGARMQAYLKTGSSERSVVDKLTGKDGGERYKLWPEKAIHSLIDSMKLPGEVLKGNVDPHSEEGLKKALEFTQNFGMLGLATAGYRPGVGMFGGRMSQDAVKAAENMAAKGFSEHSIKEMTGLERGVEGNWRKEFSDAGSKYKPQGFLDAMMGKPAKLSEILDHPELYKAYPEAKNLKVEFLPKEVFPEYGKFHTENNLIQIQKGMSPEDTRSTLLHELQHYIQHKEGFGILTPEMLPDAFREELKGSLLNHYGQKPLNAIIETMQKGDYDTASKMAKALLNAGDFKVYKNLATEVEARNVQARRNIPAANIKLNLGRDTEDVARTKQIILKNNSIVAGEHNLHEVE